MAESNRKGSFWLFEAGQRSLDATWELVQNNSQYGWFAEGFSTGPNGLSTLDRIDFSNDTTTASDRTGGLQTARLFMAAAGNANYAWFCSGRNPVGGPQDLVERVTYANDLATSSFRNGLGITNSQAGAASNSYYGWFAGGLEPSVISTVVRLDFANDNSVSASVRGPLAIAYGSISGLGNQYYGWFGGGQATLAPAPTQYSYVQRIDYANDSPTSAIPRAPLGQARSATAGVANLNYGWWGGGYVFPASYSSRVDRIDFSNDSPTAATTRGSLTSVKANTAASGNQNYGWFSGSAAPSKLSSVDRIDWSNDTVTASVRGPLSLARGQHASAAGIASYPQTLPLTALTPLANYGWWAGGYAPGNRSTVDRIDFSNDSPTAAIVRGSLLAPASGNAATSNTYYGWVSRGDRSTVNRIDMSNDTAAATPRGSMIITNGDTAAAGNNNYGWFAGGGQTNLPAFTNILRIDYSNDNNTVRDRARLNIAGFHHAAAGNTNYGWFAGGYITPPIPAANCSKVERIDYANDLVIGSTRSSLLVAKPMLAATANTNYGWFSGGQPSGSDTSQIERIDFANDLVATSSRGFLSITKSRFKGSGNSSYGWFGAGYNSSNIDRINYANDTATASIRGPLSSTRYAMASFSNYVATVSSLSPALSIAPYPYGGSTVGTNGGQNYGWFGGGSNTTPSINGVSSIDRIDFSNDSTSLSARGPLSYQSGQLMAMSNQNYGWWCGGYVPLSTSIITRVDFSNDLATSSSRGTQTSDRKQGGAVSNSNYGWIGFGTNAPATSSIDRIDFSNDSGIAMSRGRILFDRSDQPGAVSNANYGWFGGGLVGNTRVERLDFSNDSPTTTASRGFMSLSKGGISASGNANYGWFANGYNITPGTTLYSTIERLDFSNDTILNSIRSVSSYTRYHSAGAGTANYGWHGAGRQGNGGAPDMLSLVDRIDYANDTNANALRRSSINQSRHSIGAVSNYVK